jgi:hypothetical protein
VLAFFVIKIEQRRAVEQGSAKVCLPPNVPSLLATSNPPISSFRPPVLIGKSVTKNRDFEFKRVSEQRDETAFLTGTDSQTEMAVTHSKQRTAQILTGARIAHFCTWQMGEGSLLTGTLARDLVVIISTATTRGVA